MSCVASMEWHKDVIGETLYASRNHNQLRHAFVGPAANRSQVDWNLTLRQVRKPKPMSSASMPNLPFHTAELSESRKRTPLAPAHPDGPYHSESPTLGKYQNYANSCHMLKQLDRVSSGAAHSINWQLNLRDGLHGHEFASSWKRHYARPQQSFDMTKENCSADNEAYQKSQITPQDRRPDRRSGAISIATIRDDPVSFRRWPGCEGTQVGAWRHLIEDTKRGQKVRRCIQAEVTLRENPQDRNGARIYDNRSDGCIVEMLGKKRWTGSKSHIELAARLPNGDPKHYHLSQLRPEAEADEDNRRLRMSKQPRTDANIPETRTPL
jgi:hypothetical protein